MHYCTYSPRILSKVTSILAAPTHIPGYRHKFQETAYASNLHLQHTTFVLITIGTISLHTCLCIYIWLCYSTPPKLSLLLLRLPLATCVEKLLMAGASKNKVKWNHLQNRGKTPNSPFFTIPGTTALQNPG